MKLLSNEDKNLPPVATAIQNHAVRHICPERCADIPPAAPRYENFRDFVVKLRTSASESAESQEHPGLRQEQGAAFCRSMAVVTEMVYGSAGKGAYGSLFDGLAEGAQGEGVKELQRTLVRWNPSWKKSLHVDGIYGPITHHALEVFKKAHGYGRDGSSVDGRTAGALGLIAEGKSAVARNGREECGDLIINGWIGKAGRVQKASAINTPGEKRDEEYPASPAAIRIKKAAHTAPSSLVTYQGHRMQAFVAFDFIRLEQLVGKHFPGSRALITSTMTGRHLSGAHYEGRAIDFVLTGRDGESLNLSAGKARALEQLCRDSGFSTYNEYLNDSPYKTGPHMHISKKDIPLAAAAK